MLPPACRILPLEISQRFDIVEGAMKNRTGRPIGRDSGQLDIGEIPCHFQALACRSVTQELLRQSAACGVLALLGEDRHQPSAHPRTAE